MPEHRIETMTLWVRGISMLLAVALIVTDYMLDLWVRHPPDWVYILTFGLAIGVEFKSFRVVLIKLITAFADKGGKL